MTKKHNKLVEEQIQEILKHRKVAIANISHWIFTANTQIDNPMKQDAFTNQIRGQLGQVREYNFQIQSLKHLLEDRKGEQIKNNTGCYR